MKKTQKQGRIENELSAMGYTLGHGYIVFDAFGNIDETFQTLDEIDRWLGEEEARRMGFAGAEFD